MFRQIIAVTTLMSVGLSGSLGAGLHFLFHGPGGDEKEVAVHCCHHCAPSVHAWSAEDASMSKIANLPDDCPVCRFLEATKVKAVTPSFCHIAQHLVVWSALDRAPQDLWSSSLAALARGPPVV